MHTMQDRKETGWVVIPGRAIQSKVPKKGIPGVGPSGTFHSCPRACWVRVTLSLQTDNPHFGLGFLPFYCSLSLVTNIHWHLPLNRLW